MSNRGVAEIRAVAAAVPDPELPVVTLGDLGILRDVRRTGDGGIEVVITPTYSGCPAMDAIRDDLRRALPGVSVVTVLSPPWTTDWITEEGRRKLREHGISPPGPTGGPVALTLAPACPRCGSLRTRLVSRYGSTACQAHFACRDCLEPFDHVKEI
ncbi:phenylacetate-CoA oxygenase subunit PaaJ [Nonomuraea sp. NN258]|uniref:1,2-phenylacetyl-CoA epoxidase subunit PaaD n=1 Tax=Nonomuraea antri TaxID=2730852 RepID=UPI00156A0B06|nr:1,2-phenylacetyl-CoA epoxidase subunit PaaD [Nonomuraea antri]NRQ35078.1 phenylacetate-CoA oxygenase subunit PaaJ [Nonomuraea antri]